MNYKITDREFLRASEAITSILGLKITREGKSSFVRNLVLVSKNFGYDEPNDFIRFISKENLKTDQKARISQYFTVNETYFWREPAVFDALTGKIIPGLTDKKRNTKKHIRIWSAGCSSGEEPYSLAIALIESIPDIDEWDIRIIASDINPVVLSKAREGVYGYWSFRNTPEWVRSKYFTHYGHRTYKVKDKVRNLVEFKLQSLSDSEPYSGNEAMDIIFCRNVLMYFSGEILTKLVHVFFDSLIKGGWFAVSSCELSTETFGMFDSVSFAGAILYRKEVSVINKESRIYTDAIKAKYYDEEALLPVMKIEMPDPATLGNGSAIPEEKTVSETIEPDLFLNQENPVEIPDSDTQNCIQEVAARETIILTMAGAGLLDDALEACNEAIKASKLDSRFYYIKATILMEMGRNTDALNSLRQLLFIDPDHAMGHFSTGYILMKQGDIRKAKLFYGNVLNITKNMSDAIILPCSEGLSLGHIRDTINSNQVLNF